MPQFAKGLLLAIVIIAISSSIIVSIHSIKAEPKPDLHQPPQALLVKAVHMKEIPLAEVPHAIDFGIGVGNETLYLLKSGFKVTAIDKTQRTFSDLQHHLEGKPYFSRLRTIATDCTSTNWEHISTSDFFLASFALPFCPPKHFQHTWQNIKSHIKPGGYFVGQFYDPAYQGLTWWQRRHMTFLTQEQVLNLFDDFDIKYISRKKEHLLGAKGSRVQAEYYEVIAQKRLDKTS